MAVGEATGARGRTRARKRLHAPLRYLKTETPAASAEVLYVARQRFVWGGEEEEGGGRSVYVCQGWRRGVGVGEAGGWGALGPPPPLPDSDAVRAATIQQPAGTSNKTPTPHISRGADRGVERGEEERRTSNAAGVTPLSTLPLAQASLFPSCPCMQGLKERASQKEKNRRRNRKSVG